MMRLLTSRRGGRDAHRRGRAALVALAAFVAGATCRDTLTGPGLPARAGLRVAPSFGGAAQEGPAIFLARLRAEVTAVPGGATLVDTVADFPSGGAPLALELTFP